MVAGREKRYVRSDTVLWRHASGIVIALPDDGDEVYQLRGSAATLWDVLTEPATLPEAAATLATMFDAPARQIEADLEPVVADLTRRGLISRVDGA